MYFKALEPFFRIPSMSAQKVSQFFQQYQFDNIYQQTMFCSAGVGIGLSGERVSLGFQKNSQLTHHSGSVLCSALGKIMYSKVRKPWFGLPFRWEKNVSC